MKKQHSKKYVKKFNVSIIEEQNKLNYHIIHYDFKTSDNISYEVKADIMSNKTNNFFIEYQQFNELSGISITTAINHILINNMVFYCIATNKIRKLIELKHFPTVSTKDGNSKGFLIPIKVIQNNSIII